MSYQTKCAGTAGLPYVTTSNGGITVGAFPPVAPAFTWQIVTSADNVVQIASFNGYICEGGIQVVFLLPLAPTLGDPFIIMSSGATFQITQNGAQSIRVGANATTPGIGTLTSNTVGDDVLIYYIGSNNFQAMSPQGTLTTA